MARRRLLVAAWLAWVALPAITFATPLELEYIGNGPWTGNACVGGTIQALHGSWHTIPFAAAVRGREFIEFHREFLAQSDDFRLYGCDVAPGVDPDAAVISVVAEPGSILKFDHANLNGYMRPALHTIDPIHGGGHPSGTQSSWVPRPANLRLGNGFFHGYSFNNVGVQIDGTFHGNGHMSIARHDIMGPVGDMGGTLNATRDGAFFQWHKNVDSIAADWAVGQYQTQLKTGLPIYLSVRDTALGAAGSALNDRTLATEYQCNFPPLANQYGASPRIPSDIYVGDMNNTNLLYHYGIRRQCAPGPLGAWDIDAWTILNPAFNGWYFSVTMASAGAPGTAVALQPVRGGDVFESGGGGANAVKRTEAQLGLLAAASDELDAIELDEQKRVQATNDDEHPGIADRTKQWFSLRAGSTFGVLALGGGAVGPSDILQFNANGDLIIAVPAATLALAGGDELDALAIVDIDASNTLSAPDRIYYSLAAGSPALAANSPADIFCHTVGGATCGALGGRLEMTAAMLGLLATDELDALDVRATPTGVGACCLPGGTCNQLPPVNCSGLGGTFVGPETICHAAECPSAPGACCLPNGMCNLLSDRACLDALGTFGGPGVPCDQCPTAPPNDDCGNAYPIPYNYGKGYEPPPEYRDNSYATYTEYYDPNSPPISYLDPSYSCADHMTFYPPYASGTVWYSYDVPTPKPGKPTRGLYLTTYEYGPPTYPDSGGAGDTRLAIYYAPSGDCYNLQEVACGDNYEDVDPQYRPYASVGYYNPPPGRYYVQLGTVGDVNRGKIALRTADPRCQVGKKKCVTKKVQCLLKCHIAAEKRNVPVDPACTNKCRLDFEDPIRGCFPKLEARGGCIKKGLTAAMEAKIDAFVDQAVQSVHPGYPAPVLNACSAGKKKCISKKVGLLLKCHQKAEKTGIYVDPLCLQRARAKFDGGGTPEKGCFEKLEAKYPPVGQATDCLTYDDTASVEMLVDEFVDDAVCEIDPAAYPGGCPH